MATHKFKAFINANELGEVIGFPDADVRALIVKQDPPSVEVLFDSAEAEEWLSSIRHGCDNRGCALGDVPASIVPHRVKVTE
jgi:hypothetical protein